MERAVCLINVLNISNSGYYVHVEAKYISSFYISIQVALSLWVHWIQEGVIELKYMYKQLDTFANKYTIHFIIASL